MLAVDLIVMAFGRLPSFKFDFGRSNLIITGFRVGFGYLNCIQNLIVYKLFQSNNIVSQHTRFRMVN